MAILVAGSGDSASAAPGSALERAYAGLVKDMDPVWVRVAIELGVDGFVHLEPDEGAGLGPAGVELLARVRGAQLAERRAYAEGLLAVAELAALIEARRPVEDQAVRPGSRVVPGEWVAQLLAFELGISTRAAMERLGRAGALQGLPRTLAALQAGWLGVGAANALLASTAGVDAAALDSVEAAVFDSLGHRRLPDQAAPLGSWEPAQLAGLQAHPRVAADLDAVATPAWVRARARTAIRRLEPEALRRQVRAARSRREVRIWNAAEPGMAWLALLGTEAEVAACYARIDSRAHDRHRSVQAEQVVDPVTGELPTLGNTRADVVVDQLLGPRPDGTPGPPVNLTVHLLPGPPEEEPAGSGPPETPIDPRNLPAGQVGVDAVGEVVRPALDELVRMAQRSGGGPVTAAARGRVVVRTMRPAPCPGHPAAGDPGRYRPSLDLAAQVVSRDQTCRFPGCAVPTCICNLAALCRRHHRVKTHHVGWRLANHGAGGRMTWTTPTGRTIDTHPGRGSPEGRGP